MKYKHISLATLLVIFAGLWIWLEIRNSPTEVFHNQAVESAGANIPKTACGKNGSHEGCSHGQLFSYDPEILAQNEAHTKKRLYTQLPVNHNSTKLVESIDAESNWKGQIGGAIRARKVTIAPEFLTEEPFQKGEVITLNLFGLTNLQEFAFGMNPNSSAMAPLSYVSNGSTVGGTPIVEKPGAMYRAVFARRKDYAAAGLTYTVSFSADLATWTTSASAPVRLSGINADPVETVGIDFPASVPLQAGGNAAPKFFRVAVSNN